tara:strand:- start:352 stop:825 length:474 start_codon:yes stop_codon:yes gene_type:complete
MNNKPHYILDEINLMKAGLKVVVFDQYGNFEFDSFVVFDPSETSSKGWEVWYTEWNGAESNEIGDPDKGDVKRKLIEIHSDWVTSTEHVHLVCQSLTMGYEVGDHDGRMEMQSSMRFALAALTGGVELDGLREAAQQDGFMPKEDGSSFANKDKALG